ALRLVVGQEHDSGWINTNVANNANDGDLKNIRLKATVVPFEDLTIKASAAHAEARFGAPPQATKDFSPSTQEQPISSHYSAYDIKIDYSLPWFTVSNATSYFSYLNDGSLDTQPGATGDNPPLTTRINSRVFTDELNLNSKMD